MGPDGIIDVFEERKVIYMGLNSENLTNCLSEDYQLNQKMTEQILTLLSPLLENKEYQSEIDKFIAFSKELEFPEGQESVLRKEDAIFKASKWHQVLFENKKIRILYICVKPGESVPFHSHQWNSITVTVQGSLFTIEDLNRNLETDDWEIVAEKLDAHEPLAYQNIGKTEFKAISFEVKN